MKSLKILGFIVLISAIIAVAIYVHRNFNSFSVNTELAEKIVLEVEPYIYYGSEKEGLTVEINQADVEILKRIFNGTAVKDSPACPFGGVYITFVGGDKSLTVCPAGDGCDTVRVERSGENYYYFIGYENNETMRNILANYGVIWPFI